MKKAFCILFTLLFCSISVVRAQYDVHFTHYWEMQNFYNPAGAGAKGKLHAFAAYSNQLSGFEGNPKSMLINADMPLSMFRGDHSIGVGVLNDEIGMFVHQHLFMNYAYGLKLFGGILNVGAQLGLLNAKFEPKDLNLGENKDDPAFPSSAVDGNKLDFGAGLLYRHKYFYVGLSALHINAPLIEMGEKNQLQVDPYFNFMTGGNIKLKNPLITIQPSLQLMTDFVAWRADITARGTYNYENRILFGGVTYSPATSVILFAGLEFSNITLSYGYEMFISGIGAQNGSHDIYIGYDIELNLAKKGKNKHNSIRILK